jgi:hypothetical protein
MKSRRSGCPAAAVAEAEVSSACEWATSGCFMTLQKRQSKSLRSSPKPRTKTEFCSKFGIVKASAGQCHTDARNLKPRARRARTDLFDRGFFPVEDSRGLNRRALEQLELLSRDIVRAESWCDARRVLQRYRPAHAP